MCDLYAVVVHQDDEKGDEPEQKNRSEKAKLCASCPLILCVLQKHIHPKEACPWRETKPRGLRACLNRGDASVSTLHR